MEFFLFVNLRSHTQNVFLTQKIMSHSIDWTGLGSTLPPGGKVDVGGVLYDVGGVRHELRLR